MSVMGHLTPGELVDLAEGSRDDARIPHLSGCDLCRRQLADLRAMISVDDVTAGGDVPEPSPLFWDHLSARVHDAVRSEELPSRAALLRFWPRVTVAALGVVLVSAIVAGLGSRLMAPGSQTATAPPPPGPPSVVVRDAQVALPALPASPDDPSLSLVADYGGTLEWDELREQMAVPVHSGSLDAVGELNADERLELHRLLKEELARPAARIDRS